MKCTLKVLHNYNGNIYFHPTGAWGARIHQQRKQLYDAAYKMFYESKHKLQYGYDQILLREIFWPLTFNNSVGLFVNRKMPTRSVVITLS